MGREYCWTFPDVNEKFENTQLHFYEEGFIKPTRIAQLEVPYVVTKGFWTFELEQKTEDHHVVVKDALGDELTFHVREGQETGGKRRY